MQSEYLDFRKSIDDLKLKQAAEQLSAGNIGVFPTDTVYGIGCHAFMEDSILQLFQLKHRSPSNPMNVLISDIDMLEQLAISVTDMEHKLIQAFWPGPLTIIFQKKPTVSNYLTSGLPTVGIRMPNHAVALRLIQYTNTPIATTSANISGFPAGTHFSDIASSFHSQVSFMIDGGPSPIGFASTIVKIENHSLQILRKGSISENEIRKVLKRS